MIGMITWPDATRNGSDHQNRRSVRTLFAMRQDSVHDGGASPVSAAASDSPSALRSCSPRTGSRSRSAITTASAIAGIAITMNGTCQYQTLARKPAAIGPMKLPTRLAR